MIKLPEIQAGVREAGSILRSLSEQFITAWQRIQCEIQHQTRISLHSRKSISSEPPNQRELNQSILMIF